MGTKPTKAAANIYCQCRLEASKINERLKSREGAADLLGLSISTLSDYELGLTKIVPVDKVALMSDLYNAPELKNYYCREICPLGCDSPKIMVEDLDRVTLRTLSVSEKIEGFKSTLLNIVADGIISEDEKPDLNRILSIMDEVDAVFHTFRLWAEKNLKEEY
jgi:transcriptional regulator with XRE-family HTH domain